jgi:hypothetical protein
MAMTNLNMAPEVSPNPVAPKLTSIQVIAAATKARDEEAAMLAGTGKDFQDEIEQEELTAKRMLATQKAEQAASSVAIHDLTEDDAYNLDIAINAKGMVSPSFLKVELLDKNYIARWCNRNSVRQAQLVAQGFRMVRANEVANLESLDMFLDSQDNFVYSDLVAMKMLKNVYYAGIRKAYLKSLHATNNRKAAQAGAAFASSQMKSALSGSERSYMATHDLTDKPIYDPNIGV